ncbi:MAG: glycine zipper family protein [Candidatus Rokuibacteriota bacterium]
MRARHREIRAAKAAAITLTLVLGGCAGMTDTQQRATTGTAMGAAGGAALGAIAGNAAMGAAIGAGVGLLGGLLVDEHEKSKAAAYDQGVRDGRAGR